MRENNFRFGVYNGWLVLLADGMMNPSIVIAAFATQLGASNVTIGLIPALSAGMWFLPQLYVASIVRSYPRKLPVYNRMANIRTTMYMCLALTSFLFIGHPNVLLTVFLLCIAGSALAAGITGLPWLEVVSKVIPQQERPLFFGIRNLGGGILAFGAGILIRFIMGSGLPFPYNYSLIFFLGGLIYTAGYALFGHIKEPEEPVQPRTNVLEDIRNIPNMLRADPDLRRFLVARAFVAIAGIAEPFFAVYALKQLHMESNFIGYFLMVIAGVVPLSNLFWTWIGTDKGNRRVMRIATSIAVLAPVVALLTPPELPIMYLLVFVLYSMAQQGYGLAFGSYTLNISPAHDRSRYLGTMNTLMAFMVFAPAFGGALADHQGFKAVFYVSICAFVLAWLFLSKLRKDA
ncbi:MFS transporter [Deinococcus roseus]|uniref:MFS transporter n=1 Tax=Deinococcus roseus TaxID=392414 RepID=A0ABQ2CXY3_9DEIO|nr:MFS transporter [Deinococcus roseus]GGJ31600.1 MFS transporter [Deinococcus roseus]